MQREPQQTVRLAASNFTAACKQQVALQFVHKSGGVTTVEEAKNRQAQCETMFRD